jgi:hypothetical protein
MPVESTHEQYSAYSAQWQRARDCLEGDEKVKSRGESYLPKLEGMNGREYLAYVKRSLFYNATGRTVQGLTGAMFRRAPTLTGWPEGLAKDTDNITLTGVSLTAFAKGIGQEVISVGRGGVIVDMPEKGAKRPYFRFYRAEDIPNWQTDYEAGVPVLTMVVLKECRYEPKAGDPFQREEVDYRRVLGLEVTQDDEGNVTGKRYYQELWRKQPQGQNAQNGSEFVMVGARMYPNKRGTPFDYIPFQFFGPTGLMAWCEKSPILDLVDANLSHYRTSADLEHGAHFTALPTPWVTGVKPDSELKIGSGTAWILPQDCSAGMLEYTGQGLGALENREKAKREYMAVLGARLLEDQKADAEAAATVKMRHSGENSVLAAIADTTGRGIRNCLTWYLAWLGQEAKDLDYAVNKDFFDEPMSPEDLKALVTAWQSGAIGGSALYWNIKRGERLPEDMTEDEWREDVEANGPSLALMGLDDPKDAEDAEDADASDEMP